MKKRMSINAQLVRDYSNDVKLHDQSDIVNEGSSPNESPKDLKPTDSTRIKPK